jgi:hypothetical protein
MYPMMWLVSSLSLGHDFVFKMLCSDVFNSVNGFDVLTLTVIIWLVFLLGQDSCCRKDVVFNKWWYIYVFWLCWLFILNPSFTRLQFYIFICILHYYCGFVHFSFLLTICTKLFFGMTDYWRWTSFPSISQLYQWTLNTIFILFI